MKRIFLLTLLLVMSFCCLACGQKTETATVSKVTTIETKTEDTHNRIPSAVIVLYFSQTGNTATIGDNIADILKADKYVIKAKVPYTTDDLNYNDDSTRATVEQRDESARPEIAGDLPDLSKYDTVYIGYPIWWGKAPKIVYTFVEKCDLSGKEVIPFCVSAQSGMGDSARILEEVSKGKAHWHEGRRFSTSASKDEIKNWVNNQ